MRQIRKAADQKGRINRDQRGYRITPAMQDPNAKLKAIIGPAGREKIRGSFPPYGRMEETTGKTTFTFPSWNLIT